MESIVIGASKGQRCADTSIARGLYVNRRRMTVCDRFRKARDCHKCPVIGCDFWSYAPDLINEHMCEEHRAANDAVEINEDVRVVVTGDEDVERASGVVGVIDVQNDSAHHDSRNDEYGAGSEPELTAKDDFGPVLHEALSNQCRKTIILYESKRYPGKVSEWALKVPSNDATTYYTCVLCRKVKDRGKRQMPPVDYPPAARIMVRNGRFLVDPDYPKSPHICDFENNPLSNRDSVLSRRSLAKKLPDGSHGIFLESNSICPQQSGAYYLALPPSELPTESEIYITDDTHAWTNDPESLSISNSNGSYIVNDNNVGTSTGPMEEAEPDAFGRRNEERDCSLMHRSRMLINCSIVGCSFSTNDQEEMNNHISDHELLDDPVEEILVYDDVGADIYGGQVAHVLDDDDMLEEPSSIHRKILSNGGCYGYNIDSELSMEVETTVNVDDLRRTVKSQFEELCEFMDAVDGNSLCQIHNLLSKLKSRLVEQSEHPPSPILNVSDPCGTTDNADCIQLGTTCIDTNQGTHHLLRKNV